MGINPLFDGLLIKLADVLLTSRIFAKLVVKYPRVLNVTPSNEEYLFHVA